MRDSNLFNARGGDGGALQHPGQWWFRRRGGAKRVHRPAFYHQIITFRLPNGSTVDLLLVITTRQKWEAKDARRFRMDGHPFPQELGHCAAVEGVRLLAPEHPFLCGSSPNATPGCFGCHTNPKRQ